MECIQNNRPDTETSNIEDMDIASFGEPVEPVGVGTLAEVLGKEDADKILSKLEENHRLHRETFRRIGKRLF